MTNEAGEWNEMFDINTLVLSMPGFKSNVVELLEKSGRPLCQEMIFIVRHAITFRLGSWERASAY